MNVKSIINIFLVLHVGYIKEPTKESLSVIESCHQETILTYMLAGKS